MCETSILNQENLIRVPQTVVIPSYSRIDVSTGIVHLGVGNFHRGHQAVYTDAVLARGDTSWGIIGVSLRSQQTRTLLQRQDFLYSVNFKDSRSECLQVVGSVMDVLCAPDDPEKVLKVMCDPSVKIVSLTITEKGYAWPSGELPDWRSSQFHTSNASALLYIVEALYRRHQRGLPPFTLLSCDNLPGNGKILKSLVIDLAKERDHAFAESLADGLACPSSMVDRIVPQPTARDLANSTSLLGVSDHAAIVTEPFGQWIIEDNFPTGRPEWSICDGVEFTSDVTPYEEMKLRLLNGAHTFIALFGQLSGHRYVSDVMQSRVARRFLGDFWQSTFRTLGIGRDLSQYTNHLVERFNNRYLCHETSQIASDTSQKISQRIVQPLLALYEINEDTKYHSAIVALWYEYLRTAANVVDPLSTKLVPLANSSDLPLFIAQSSVFADRYCTETALIDEVELQYKLLRQYGLEALIFELDKQ